MVSIAAVSKSKGKNFFLSLLRGAAEESPASAIWVGAKDNPRHASNSKTIVKLDLAIFNSPCRVKHAVIHYGAARVSPSGGNSIGAIEAVHCVIFCNCLASSFFAASDSLNLPLEIPVISAGTGLSFPATV
jgi:hypothetical protein